MHCEGAEGTSVNMAAVTLPVRGSSCRGISAASGYAYPVQDQEAQEGVSHKDSEVWEGLLGEVPSTLRATR